jgi:hypothetical protein
MPGDDKAVTRTVAAIVLLMLAIVALRGYLPEAEPAPDSPEPASSGPGAVVAIVALLIVSISIMVISIIGRARRRPTAPSAGELLRDRRGGGIRVPWRLLLIAAGITIVWLLVVLLLMRWRSEFVVDAPMTDPDSVIAPEGDPNEPAPPQSEAYGRAVFGLLVAATIAMFVLSIAANLIGRERTNTATPVPAGEDAPSAAPSEGPDLARAAELGLAEIGDYSRDPREAIIACYATMERELEKSPGTTPQDSDTPSEVLARAVERQVLQADSAAELVDLFQEARFSPHMMNEGHRADALRALRLVQRELQGVT